MATAKRDKKKTNITGLRVFLLLVLLALVLVFGARFLPKRPLSEADLHQQKLHHLAQLPLPNKLVVPVDQVLVRQIADTWGGARSEGRRHEGVDIFAPRGTAVISTTVGIVQRIGVNRLGGKNVAILGPNSSWHYYAHLENYAADLRVGDWVQAGQVIGYVGNSGNASRTPPHLHYGIYLNQQAINPYPYLQDLPRP